MMLKIKPAEGKTIRDPLTMELLAPEGEEKPRNSFWIRRLVAGDVVEVGSTENTDVVEVGSTENTADDTDAALKKTE
ncbi:TPA: DUF2635 domain-containing protein [Escherichia coli]|jgi:hypothetical protein|uniref:DUF2635 domain-containing protein n=1 Tax=Escherichia coli TaxID=562 RepID=UPI0002CA5418|nr:DUF2635 domain-containing protein [Escherichia coli]EJB0095757.1 DUF2635 domain-containing protein [Escherichia coli]EMW41830.1 hypothetical protein EC2788150_2216 [Escherichia coli 2788150]ENA09741.1 hypothetical protein ECP02999171_1756 [Escherichia coli P0299917.1]ENC35369.1 hypothetical protein ECP029970676_1689 [Escherichia coli P02997067.6]ENC42016.1 hypothetical protein ECP02999172_5242 [Escherichia coli P0299917.2]